jgi:hypothetical protein
MNEFEKLALLADHFEKLAEKSRGDCVFKANTGKNKSSKDHFPINDEGEARDALARASQYSSAPEWYAGDLQSLVSAVARKVHSKYPGIKETSKSKTPGKG